MVFMASRHGFLPEALVSQVRFTAKSTSAECVPIGRMALCWRVAGRCLQQSLGACAIC